MKNDIPGNIKNTQIENVEGYIYLGRQRYSTRNNNQDKDIQRRITAGWTAFAKHRDIFKGNIGTSLKRQVYISCVFPAVILGAETWTLTRQANNSLAPAHTDIKRTMLNITYRNRKKQTSG